jgi:hypothetical protein
MVYIYTSVSKRTHAHTHTRTHACTHTRTHAHTHTHSHTHTHVQAWQERNPCAHALQVSLRSQQGWLRYSACWCEFASVSFQLTMWIDDSADFGELLAVEWGYENLPSDLGQNLRAALVNEFSLTTSQVVARTFSHSGGFKLVIELQDGHLVETVVIRHEHLSTQNVRHTICVSSQVRCACQRMWIPCHGRVWAYR